MKSAMLKIKVHFKMTIKFEDGMNFDEFLLK